ncbi:MAG: 8-oxo-dGTP diphosphatase [Spirochaetales bacterium]|nr:8-oxo-dGTP diphosphatase [Spirochaetales bacterium]
MILETIERFYSWALIGILLLNLTQRKIPNSHKKRTATLYIASVLLLFQLGIITILTKGWSHYLAIPLALLCVLIIFLLRKRAWPFKLRCVECSAKLDFNHVIGGDENLCKTCWEIAHPQQAEQENPIEVTIDVQDVESVEQIDWEIWEPSEICVITYLFDDDRVLLIDKKRGLGRGLVNAPGGHIEEDETAMEAAIREFKEETRLDISDLEMVGVLNFQFRDGLAEKAYVFFTRTYTGELAETDEARSFWVPISEIPYDRMWEDDLYWLPPALEGKHFEGFFIFDGQTMVDKRITFKTP